ncbi:flagellar hook-length control protein FliK [Tardiphaga sp. 42S5]|uniref:flagellar hook-length control protein FliK n=1 Tax=Tardiphaga sp. 42S5 TaxID=1404799 RepID=UPI002A5A243D|nr:flagellar hook-length control protein FliK [Tardiphaga sp. 42S5]WPO40171.1 flagellar hook-length control protein FliK [Tardiphaga sp. 42S5]
MPTPVNSILPVVSAQGVASEVAFQPGSVIAGRVLSVSPDNQVRIAIGHSTIDVQSQVPLQAGQVLQFAVSKTDNGNVQLAIVTPQNTGAGQAGGTSSGDVTLAPDLPINLANAIATSKIQLTSLEAQAVSTATQSAVTQQASLATLFANLGVATSLKGLPQQLQQAVAQVLAQRPPLDSQLTGEEVKSAFQNSGLFLESSLAKGSLPQGGLPDMKAALIVLRQALATTLATASPTQSTTPATANAATPEQPASALANALPNAAAQITTQQAQAAAATVVMLPKTGIKNDPLQQAGLLAADEPVLDVLAQTAPAVAKAPEAAARLATNGAALNLLREALQTAPKGMGSAASLVFDDSMMMDLLPATKAPTGQTSADTRIARNTLPPPPLRGGLPTAQPMALPTLPANAPLGTTVHHLLADTDAALARQTLLQVASLPDRADGLAVPRLDQASPRWSFEIPFAVPAGTAMAQFEISRDGGNGSEAEAAKQVWRARFSLDVEPAGPVHALVSLTGDKTSVRMWAERPATALQLQAGAAQLNQALIRANLQPGDIVVREGAPMQPAPASAGHFLDRAL